MDTQTLHASKQWNWEATTTATELGSHWVSASYRVFSVLLPVEKKSAGSSGIWASISCEVSRLPSPPLGLGSCTPMDLRFPPTGD
ncbi:unnamed protein product [Penicillium roqueforti FM164]|uniref:Genomic scaffold, ProqFM164S02 n=1 Tax=Penicillium roqueforti (strain FM164) TaxID=1365484 RepID=W6Q5Y8_PENRF|nr:unnamed protein product [Penicillium roqueforti FM164]